MYKSNERPTFGVLAGWEYAWTRTPLSYLDPIFQGVCAAAHDLECNVLVGCGMGSGNRGEPVHTAWPFSSPESDFVPIGPWNTDGLIIVNPLHSSERSRYVQDLIVAGHPVIFIAPGEPGPTIAVDNRSGIHEAMRHLIMHGHRNIAFIAGSPEDMAGDSGDRLRAYHEAIAQHGLSTEPRTVAWGHHLFDGGYAAMQQILASQADFTAVLASNDESAMGAMQALREVGRSIPGDVAVIGFDDRPESAVQHPSLSSVRVPLRRMGYHAVESLKRYVTGESKTIESTLVATHLVPRESCGCGQSDLSEAATDGLSVHRLEHKLRHNIVNHHWTLSRLGTLTARLLSALDEKQVFEILAQQLLVMDVQTAWVALFIPQDDDPVALITLQDVMDLAQDQHRIPSRTFPPTEMLATDSTYSLALFPLTGPHGQLGFIAFDTARLDLYGVLAQQLVTALNSVRLYHEAVEGRQLAEEATALKSRFLSTVSHELRTPLNLVVGLSEILLQEIDEGDVRLSEPYRRDVENIHTNAQHLGKLIGDVLDLASSDAGQLRLTKEWVDLSAALRLVAETGRQLAYDKGLEWRVTLPASGPWVWGDRTRLQQVALNLISNAVKFTDQGKVSLELQVGPDLATVAVHDTGLGIPPEEQELIFDEFRRSERSLARSYGGLGLGLAICQRLVTMHGGTLSVSSTGVEGAGSTFEFTLPIMTPPAIQSDREAIPDRTAEWVGILTNRMGSGQRLKEHLNARGLDVQMIFIDETPDWLAGLVVAPPGALVIDIGATPHQGWDVLKALKGHPRLQDLPVLFCSLSREGGAVLTFDYLTKPIELADLTRALDLQWLVPAAGHRSKTVLVVDDDDNTLEMHVRVVENHSPSHRVLRARNGLEALDLLKQEHIDLVLLDLMMPEFDGFGILEAMREREVTRQIPVIVLTGKVLTEADMTRLNQGVATVLSKGVFSLAETLAHIETTLQRGRKLSSEAQRLVRRAMAYIHTHYTEPISRADIARHVALSNDYLTFCFRKELGITPIAYLNRYRVNQAKNLLATTYNNITEIAMEVGFSDSGYFSRVFRREVGMSPDAYRRT